MALAALDKGLMPHVKRTPGIAEPKVVWKHKLRSEAACECSGVDSAGCD